MVFFTFPAPSFPAPALLNADIHLARICFANAGGRRAGPKRVPMQTGWAGLTRPKTDKGPGRDVEARPVNNSPPGALKQKTTGIKRTLTYIYYRTNKYI